MRTGRRLPRRRKKGNAYDPCPMGGAHDLYVLQNKTDDQGNIIGTVWACRKCNETWG